jgi:hypothetical protein
MPAKRKEWDSALKGSARSSTRRSRSPRQAGSNAMRAEREDEAPVVLP